MTSVREDADGDTDGAGTLLSPGGIDGTVPTGALFLAASSRRENRFGETWFAPGYDERA
jgi:hypothetical protein